MLDEVRSIEDPLLRAETAGEILEEARQVRDDAIRAASRLMSVRQISAKIGMSKSTVHEIVHAAAT